MFSLFGFAAAFVLYLVLKDYKTEKAIKREGTIVSATIIAKDLTRSNSSGSPDYTITILAKNRSAASISEYISREEWESWTVGQEIELYKLDETEPLIAKVSFDRFVHDSWILYLFPCVLFLIGLACLYFLRNYKVMVDENTGDEWLEKDGKIYLDERNIRAASSLKKINIVSKLIQTFAR